MKHFIKVTALFCFTSFLSFAYASDITVFQGRYRVKLCPLYNMDAPSNFARAYLSAEFKINGDRNINLTLFSREESRTDDFPILVKPRQAPGTEVEYDGIVRETTTHTWKSPTDLEITLRVERPSTGYDAKFVTRLTLTDKTLTIKKDHPEEFCKLEQN